MSTFTALKKRAPEWEHLGMLGPLLRAEVGDTIQVFFKNHGTQSYSMHPHGVFYKRPRKARTTTTAPTIRAITA